MNKPRLNVFLILLYLTVNGILMDENTKIHKQNTIVTSHGMKQTEARLKDQQTDIGFQQDNTFRPDDVQPLESNKYRYNTDQVRIMEPNDDSEHDRLENPSVAIDELIGIKISKQFKIPRRDIEISIDKYSGGIAASKTPELTHVEAERLVCDVNQSQHGEVTANCSSRELRSVPTDLPHNITELDLSRNLLVYLANNTFKLFSNLTLLNLNFNKIIKVDIRSFAGLFKLSTLFLSGNNLRSNKTAMPPSLFSDLISLETLVIERNEFEEYPDWIFPPLKCLKNLAISSARSRPFFGPGFQHLKSLEFLQMDSKYFEGGECKIEKLETQTFANLHNASVKHLVINSCNDLKESSMNVFEPLSSLSVLELSHNQLGIEQALETLKPFDGRNMTSITMDFVGIEYTQNAAYYKELVLTNSTLHYLGRICISEVFFQRNGIVWLANFWTGSLFTKCIRKMDLSGNELKGDGKILFNLSLFELLSDFRIGMKTSFLGTSIHENHDITDKSYNVSVRKLTILFPPKITYFDITGHLGGDIGPLVLNISNSENLKSIKFGYNNLKHVIGFLGLENVTNVDLSGQTFIDNRGVLSSFPSVEHLTLSFNSLKFLSPLESKKVFENLRRLNNINLSNNHLRSVPVLPNPSLVTSINLANNEINVVSMLKDFTSLKFLDLSNNLISQIDLEVRDFLDYAQREYNLSVSVQGNPFFCDCVNVDFIVWLTETKVIFEINRDFPCTRENGVISSANEVADRYYIDNRRCNGRLYLALTVILLILLVMAIVITYYVGRNPTRVRNVIMNMFGFGVRFLTPSDFKFTLYVGYCKEDVPFVFRDLRPALERGDTKLFLHDRDVLPGESIADGVIDGVNSSWKVLLVVSYDFLDDPWSDFVMSTAFYSMTDLIPDRILVLLVGGVQVEELPEILLSAVDEEIILCADQFQGDQLWTRLKEVAKLSNYFPRKAFRET